MSSGAQMIFLRQQLVAAFRDRQLPLPRERLRLQRIFVDAAHHHRGAEIVRDRHHAFEFLFAILQIDRVDDRLALAIGQRLRHRLRIGGIYHHRRLDLANQLLVEQRNVFLLIALRALQAHIDDLRAAAHLPPRDLAGLFPLLFRHQILEQPRADHVGSLADQQRPRAVFRLNRLDPGVNRAMRLAGRTRGFLPSAICAIARMCCSVVPQHPPTRFSQP